MKITLIGTGVSSPSLRRSSPGLVMEAGEEKLLFDCGPDILRGMLAAGFRHRDIDRILVSHFHPDHTLGLGHYLFASRYDLEPRRRDLLIAGPPGMEELMERFNSLYPRWLEGKGYRVLVHEIDDHRWSGRGWRMRTAPVRHNPESIAYRVEDGRGISVVYSGDTGYCDSLVSLSRSADLLICECSFPDGRGGSMHLGPKEVGIVAWRAKVKKVLLTHMYSLCDEIDVVRECKKEFPGEVLRGEDGMKINVE